MGGEFDGYFKAIKQQDAARAATELRLHPLQPDQAAEGMGVAKELGVPPGQVMAFPELFKDRLAAQRATTALTQAPQLTDWLRSDPVKGALAKDDLDNLSWFEKGFNFLHGGGIPAFADMGGMLVDSQVGRGLRTGATGAKQMAAGAATMPLAGMQATMMERLDAYGRAADIAPGTPRHEIATQLGIDPMSPTAGIVADFVNGDEERRQWHLERAAQVIQSNTETMDWLTGKVREFEEQMKATQGRVPNFTDISDVGEFGDWLGFNLGQAAPYLLATATAGAVAGPAGMLGVGYGMGAGDIRSEQITEGQDPFDTRAAGAAAVGAIPYAGIELIGAAARPFRGVTGEVLEQVAEGWAKRVGRETGASAVEEFINEAGQEIIKDFAVMAGGGDDVTLDDETLLRWFNSGMAGMASGGAFGGGRTALTISAERDAQRAAEAGQAASILDRVSEQAQASKLRERSPEAFKEALDRAGRGDDLVYVPAAGLREFFQARDTEFDAEMAEAWGIDLNTFGEMEISGGRVGVPMSNFAAYLAGTDAEAWVRENATLDPDEMSLADAAAFDDAMQEQIDAAYEAELSEMFAEQASRSSDQQVFDQVYGQLREAGRTVDVAQNEARVMTAFFRTMAQRIGDDSLDLLRRFGLRIQGPDGPGVPRRRGALDVMLNDLRAGRKEKAGQSLTEFIIDAGGVQDSGGDVAAIEGPRGLVAETREEIEARRSQGSLDGMPAQGRGLSLDELGRKAVEAGYFPELMGEVQGLNQGEAADLGRAVLDALNEEASGRLRYREGDGPDPARAALNEALQTRGLDPATMTNDEIAAALEQGEARSFNQGPRGSIQFPRGGLGNGETLINLFETADLSTFLHESAHLFLEALDNLAADPNAPQSVKDELATVRRYLGAEDGGAFTTDQHETFARSFEAYILEGKSPSLELADVFNRMKAWLTRIYRSIAGLNVPINAEIRGVFDRMLATDAEIDAARAEAAADPLFREKPAGMTDADWNTYQRMARRGREEAEAKLLNRVMERVRREKQAWWKAERKEVRKQVEATINTEPRYRLIEVMANGRYIDGNGEFRDAPDVRLDRAALVEQFGAGILAEMSRQQLGGKRAIYGEDGVTPAEAAEMFGFPGPVELVETLQNTGKRLDAIEAETDRIMLDRYGDVLTDGTIENEAMDAIHNDQQAQKNVAEARAMASQLGRDTRGMTATLYKQRARLMLGRMSVREAAAPARFLAAERRAGRDAERAFAKVARGDASALGAALQAKEQQILNAALYDLSRQAETEVAKARERMQGYGKKSVREKLEGGYIEQIDDLLDRYDFRKRGPGAVAKAERLREFMDRMIAEGREAELMIDPRMMDDARRVHYSRLSLDEFRGLLDTIANLDHLGRFKQKLLNARRQRDFEASRDRIIEQVRQRGRDEMSGPRSGPAQALREVLNTSKTSHTIAMEMDGLQEMGPVFDELLADVYEGEKLEAKMRIEMERRTSEIIGEHYSRKDLAAMKKPVHIPGSNGRLWSKAEVISVALNTGNEANYQRLTDETVAPSERLNRDQVEAMLTTLDENDWRFVQAYWDHIESFSPQLAEVHLRRTGVAMKKTERKMMVNAPSGVRGGYYPIKYNPLKSARAMDDQASMWDKVMSVGRSGKPEVNTGRTKERQATGGGRALRFDLGVGIEGMRETIRIITLSEAVDNSGRLLRDGEVKQTFLDRQLGHEWTMLDLTLQDVAAGPVFHNFWGEKAARVLKNNISAMFLGLNFKTTLLQATGAVQSAAVIGKKNLALGYIEYFQHQGELLSRIKAVSPMMAERELTVNKDYADMMADPANTNPVRGRISQGISTMQQIGYVPIQKMQYYTVDVPTWAGAYLSRIEAGDTEAQAVSYADLMVDRSQGGSFMSSRSAWARGTVSADIRQSAMVRIWTTLAGYMLTKLQRGVIEVQRGAKNVSEADSAVDKVRAAANSATNLTLLYVGEGLLMGIMYALASDEDEPEDLLHYLLKETGMSMAGGLPIIRDMFGFALEGRGAGGMQETIGAIPGRIWQQASQGENDRQFRKSVMDGVGLVTGIPTTATSRVIEGLIGEDDVSWFEMFIGRNPLTD